MIRLVSKGNQHYEVEGTEEDAQTMVYLDDTFETECDEPHPMRARIGSHHALMAPSNATQKGKYLTWQCEGTTTHFYSQWVVMYEGEWTDNVYDTFEHAVAALAEVSGQEVKIVRQRRVVMQTPLGATVATTLPEDTSQKTLEAISAVGDAAYRLMLEDELRAVEENLDHMRTLLATEDGPYVDMDLYESNKARKAEIENLLLTDSA